MKNAFSIAAKHSGKGVGMENKISVFSLLFFFIYAVRTGWTPILKILVILNSALVLLQTALQYKEVLHNARK